ncbi:uncharacterized protein LOC110722253 [Chenopodium quinoa]|uniref:uncharacterized protein LOC110722253 n=1 Tax=Chenopodium quinoa TaxID=63459 RepID=UPI000B786B0B|nr:uncharacterized protein LOC110722253 [Chenopodium quinoa]
MAGDDTPPPPPPQKIETNSPFYLGAHDRPGDFITPIRLHCMLVSWLMNTIDPEVKSMLSNYDNAKSLWGDLHERFCVVNGPRIQNLKAQINRCEQTKNMQHEKRREDDRLQQFLLGLCSDYYAQTRSNILAQDPLLTLNKAYQQVSQDELVRSFDRVREEPQQAVGFVVRRGGARGREGSDRTSSGSVCAKCKKGGHETSRCCQGSARANAILGSDAPSHGQAFTSEQWKAITGLFGKANENRLNGKFDVTSWIIDTGATHHVTGKDSWLFDTRSFECPVGLPNRDTVVASLVGLVRLSDKITLTGVLYVPYLSYQAKELIGMGARRDGLYYFSNSDSVHLVGVVEASSDLELWHRRMGHPSEKVVKLFPHVSSNKACLDKGCEVCMRAKHPRNKFPLSDSRASRSFEKVHCDLWGPYRHVSSCGARYFLTIVDDYSRAKTNGDKFASRSRKCVFLGYPFGKKGWKLYDLESNFFFVSRDVKFVEDVFPFGTPVDVNIVPEFFDTNSEVHGDFLEYEISDDENGVIDGFNEEEQAAPGQPHSGQPATEATADHPAATGHNPQPGRGAVCCTPRRCLADPRQAA